MGSSVGNFIKWTRYEGGGFLGQAPASSSHHVPHHRLPLSMDRRWVPSRRKKERSAWRALARVVILPPRVSLDCKVRDRLCLDDERSLWEREKEKEKREE